MYSRIVCQVESDRLRQCCSGSGGVGVGGMDQAAQILLRATNHSHLLTGESPAMYFNSIFYSIFLVCLLSNMTMTFHRGKCRFNKQSRCNVQRCIKWRRHATSIGTSAYTMFNSRHKRLWLSRTVQKWNTILFFCHIYNVYTEKDLKLVVQ